MIAVTDAGIIIGFWGKYCQYLGKKKPTDQPQ
jgi:hypothetical protein